MGRVRIRGIAVPAEHGGWGFLFEPIFMGVLAAPSVAGVLISASAVFFFLLRQPLRIALTGTEPLRANAIVWHAGALVVGAALAAAGAAPRTAIAAAMVLLARAGWGLSGGARPTRATRIGVLEIVYGLLYVILVGLGYRLGS